MVNLNTCTTIANAFDQWRSIVYALFLALVGYGVMVAVPVISSAWVEMLGFTEEQVGRVAGADLGGLSFGAVVASLLVARINRRSMVFAGLVLSIVANGLCIFVVEYEWVLWLRVMAGFANGIFTAVAIVTLGGTTKPVKAFNYLLFAFAFSTALELHLLPRITMNEIYGFFIVLNIICLLFLRWLPSRPLSDDELAQQEAEAEEVENWHVPKALPMLCLLAICLTYVNIGGYYTYIELAAHDGGIVKEWMTPVLTWSSIFSIVGCAVAMLCSRFGLFKPLLISLLYMGLMVMLPSTGINNYTIMLSLFSFMSMWAFVDVYQSAMLAHMDRRGSLVALMPGVQGFGQFIGPNIAASILGAEMGYSMVFVVSGSAALMAMIIYMWVFFAMHKRERVIEKQPAV